MLTLIVCLLSLPLLFSARIFVTSTADSGPGTLREAVMMAASGDTIRFNSSTLGQTIFLQSEIVIDKALRIRGNGIGNTNIDGGGMTRAFNVNVDGFVYIGILKITNCATDESGGAVKNQVGTLHLDGVEISNSTAAGAAATMGGGAVHNAGALLVTASRFLNNAATGASGSGGAILVTSGGISITRGTFIGNTANRAGGAIEDVSGSGLSRLNLCTMTDNAAGSAPGNGGAVHITGGSDMLIIGGTYSNNTASREGGALWNGSGTMTIREAVISDNTASGPAADDGGGGIFNNGGTLLLFAGTQITGNKADGASGSGGGVHNTTGGTLQIVGATISGNTANRAGGGIEDASGAATVFTIVDANIDNNEVFTSPGNGGGIHLGGNGSLSLTGGTVSGNTAGAEGGGVWNDLGNLVVSGTTISGNTASGANANQGGGGLYNNEGGGAIVVKGGAMVTNNTATGAAGSGGGILIDAGSSLTILNATISGNTANRAGGGIEDASGGTTTVSISKATINDNVVNNAPGNGGGIHIGGDGNMTILASTISGNTAGAEGGGVWNATGRLFVGLGTVISNNTAAGNDPDQGGGGLYNNGGGTIVVRSGTVIMGNKATGTSGSGGGILNNTGAMLDIIGSTIKNNEANRAGGGIEDVSGAATTMRISNSAIDSNVVFTSPGNGGGIHIGGDGSLTINGGTVNGNMAGAEGGGIWNNTGTLNIGLGTVIDGNTAAGNDADQGGGGLYNNGNGSIIIRNGVVISNNKATGTSGSGGGILNGIGSMLKIDGAVISGNQANRAGGGIEDISGNATVVEINKTNFTGNRVFNAPGNGGAVHVGGNGNLTITNGLVSENIAGQEGGGLWNNTGTMKVLGTVFEDNLALGSKPNDGGGALFNNGGIMTVSGATFTGNAATGAGGSGGALFTIGGLVNMLGSNFDGNTANRAGGAVEQVDGRYNSSNSNYLNNQVGAAPGNGGAFHVTGMNSTVSFAGGRVMGNSAANEGGGLWNQSGTLMEVKNVAIMNNAVTGTNLGDGGGGIFNNGGIVEVTGSTIAMNTVAADSTAGGGIANAAGGDFTLTSSTVSGNLVGGGGGGISNEGIFSVVNSTIANNTALVGGGIGQAGEDAVITLTGTILATNIALAILGSDLANDMGTVTSGNYNLIGSDDLAQFTPAANDIEGGFANLGPLADNGGATMTHALSCPSDAVDAGNPADASADQIGQDVFGGSRDIGAFELQETCTNFNGDGEVDLAANLTTTLAREVSIFPNPTSGTEVNVRIPATVSGQVTLRLIDANGRVRGVRQPLSGSVYRLPLEDLPNGTYTLQVIDGDNSTSRRLVIVR